jgi:DNA-binding NarL/FixJ family response regulator
MTEIHIIKVLLADDHAVVRAGIRQFLENSPDIRVIAETGDGLETIQLIEERLPDVAVLDIQMPGASGIEVTRQVRAKAVKNPSLRKVGLLILTAYDDAPYIMAVLQAGANGYVLKTAAPTEIIQAVRDVYAGKSALDSIVAQKLISQLAAQAAPDQAQQPTVESLTEREMEVLTMVARGYTNKAIGAQLSISDRTVQGHLAHIFAKLHAASRTEAVMRAVALNWLPPNLGEFAEES